MMVIYTYREEMGSDNDISDFHSVGQSLLLYKKLTLRTIHIFEVK